MRIPAFISLFLGLIVSLSFTNAGIAQTRVNSSGTGGIHTIQGKIYTPNGGASELTLTVRLEGTNTPGLSLITDHSGSYAFQNIAPGNYTIVVEGGENFETARESITIDQELRPQGGTVPLPPNPKTFTVPVYLQLKRSVQLKNQVLNARLAAIPNDAREHYQKGIELENDKPEQAIVEFNIALIAYPNFPECHLEIGKISLTHGKLDDAVTAFKNVVRLDPQNFDGHVNLGIALIYLKKYDEAEPELVTAALLNKNAVTPHYYIGMMYKEKKQYDVAQKAFETAKALPGGDGFPLLHRYLGGIYMTKGMNKQAVIELERFLQLQPLSPDASKVRQTISELKAKPEKLNVFS